MRKTKFAILVAVAGGLAVSALDTTAFARGAGAGAGAGGGGGGAAGGPGGAGAGSNPNMNPQIANQLPLVALPPRRFVPFAHFNALSNPCYKYAPLYDMYGNTVAGWHSSECFGD